MASEHKLPGSKEGKEYLQDVLAKKGRGEPTTAGSSGETQGGKDMPTDEPNDCTEHWENTFDTNKSEYKKFKQGQTHDPDQHTAETSSTVPDNTKKQGQGVNQAGADRKDNQEGKGAGEPEGRAGDKTRVPNEGQKVQWKDDSGLQKGEAVEVLYEDKTVNGEKVEASKGDPMVVVKNSEGKKLVRQPGELYFS